MITLSLSIVTAVMSIMNYMQRQYEMMIATTVLTVILVIILIFSLVSKLKKVINLLLCIMLSLLCLYFTLSGGNDGFAILWTLLLPTTIMLLIGFSYGVSIGIFFEVFFIVLFWTPAGNLVSGYEPTFMMRFPMLYTAFFMLSFLAKYLITQREMTVRDYIDTIERMSMIDQLTNIPNRRYFDERMRSEWNRAIRNKDPLTVMLIDVDKFKQYNDTYGHLQGDAGLQAVASVFARTLKRSEDFYARWGGEEFIILLSNTGAVPAAALAERIRQHVADTHIPLADGQPANLTISMGIHTLTPSVQNTIEAFIQCADEALYNAKHGGRNRVCVHGA
jgi:diguanylate cyclase (GGDEF)-like protein